MAATLPFLLAAFGLVALCQAGSLKFNITRRHTSIVLSRRSATDATILEMVASISLLLRLNVGWMQSAGGDYSIDATFHNDTPISVTLDTGSDKLAVPAGVQWMNCDACREENFCKTPPGESCQSFQPESFLQDTCCTTGGQVTPYYDTSTGTAGAPVTNCYGTGGWYGGCVEAREHMVESLVLPQATSTRIPSQLAAYACLT